MVGLVAAWGNSIAAADEAPQSILSVYPIGEYTCVAAKLDVGAGTPVAGIEWFHNDGQVTFPEVLVLEAIDGSPPDLQDTAMVLWSAGASELSWGQLQFAQAVTSSTGAMWVVFVLPPESEISGLGSGGGPGIGVGPQPGMAPIQLSADGVDWTAFDDDFGLAVRPMLAAMRGQPAVLAEMAVSLPDGWKPPSGEEDQIPLDTVFLGAFPNPANPATEFRFSLARDSRVSLRVYNVRGRLVRTIVNEPLKAGSHAFLWSGIDDNDQGVASGVYYSRFVVDGRTFNGRVVLVK